MKTIRQRFTINGIGVWATFALSNELVENDDAYAFIMRDASNGIAQLLTRMARERWGDGELHHVSGRAFKWVAAESVVMN